MVLKKDVVVVVKENNANQQSLVLKINMLVIEENLKKKKINGK